MPLNLKFIFPLIRLIARWTLLYSKLLIPFFYVSALLCCLLLHDINTVIMLALFPFLFPTSFFAGMKNAGMKKNLCKKKMIYLNFVRQQCVKTRDLTTARTVISGWVSLLPFLFLVCHLGERFTGAYDDFKFSAYNVSWYLYPVQNQKYILAMLVAAGQPVCFESALLDCSHGTFKKVNTFANICYFQSK